MLYSVQFLAEPTEPMLPVETLQAIGANDPISAVEKLLARGRVPQDRLLKWARAIAAVDAQGRATHAIQVPITPERIIPVDWNAEDRPMFKFTASTEGQNRFGLRELLQTYADVFGVPTHMLSDAAAKMILAEFKQRIRVELDLLTLEGERTDL